MAGFTTFREMAEARRAGQRFVRYFQKSANGEPDTWGRFWLSGGEPTAGAEPATTPGTAYTNGTGGIVFPDTSPAVKFAFLVSAISEVADTLMFYDRLVGVSGIALTSTGDKTINSTALPRYATGEGVEAWIEITTAVTSVAVPAISMNSYTDQDGNAAQVGPSLTFPDDDLNANCMLRLPLAVGDNGVRSVETVNVGTAAGTAGIANVVLIRPLLYLPLRAGEWAEREFSIDPVSAERILDGATIGIASLAGVAARGPVQGRLEVVYG